MQHYGIKTTWLDIVDNAWIALWFSLHKVNTCGDNSQYMHFDVRKSLCDGSFGYIILIRTDDNGKLKSRKGICSGHNTEVIDLRISVPSTFLRPHAQHGLLFREKAKEGVRPIDYSNSIAGIIRFNLEDAKLWLGSGAMHNVRSLFPPPYFDDGYKILLGVNLSEKSVGIINHIGA